MRIKEPALLGEHRRSQQIRISEQAHFFPKCQVREQNRDSSKCPAAGGLALLSRCSCAGTIPFCPHPHSSLFLFQVGQGGRQDLEGVSSVSLLRFLLRSQGGSQSVAKSTVLLHPAYLSPECLKLVGLRALSHLPCYDSSLNHLEPPFTRQGSAELIAHENVELVISASPKEIARWVCHLGSSSY